MDSLENDLGSQKMRSKLYTPKKNFKAHKKMDTKEEHVPLCSL